MLSTLFGAQTWSQKPKLDGAIRIGATCAFFVALEERSGVGSACLRGRRGVSNMIAILCEHTGAAAPLNSTRDCGTSRTPIRVVLSKQSMLMQRYMLCKPNFVQNDCKIKTTTSTTSEPALPRRMQNQMWRQVTSGTCIGFEHRSQTLRFARERMRRG